MTARSLLRHRLLTAAAVACVAVVGLTGCAAGQHAQTAKEISVVDGVNADVGSIALRNIGLAAPTSPTYQIGGDAQLVLAIINNSTTSTDDLTSVSTKVAATTSSTLPGQTVETPGSTESSSSEGTTASSGGTTDNGTDSSTGAAPSTTPPIELPFEPITVPAGELVAVGYGETNFATITLHGLTEALASGQTLSVTFTFTHAGSVTVTIGVRLAQGDTGGPTIDIAPSGE